MSISTSSLFHYTKSLDTLKAMLDEGLWPNYCKEIFRSSKGLYMMGIPMVSFCDIPLTRTADFCERHGHYGIALKKDWGIRKGINPVLYVTNDNIYYSLNFYRIVAKEWKKKAEDKGVEMVNVHNMKIDFRKTGVEVLVEAVNSMLADSHNNTLAGFFKPYTMTTGDGSNQDNYLENEWRYVISDTEKTLWKRSEEEYQKWRGKGDKPEPSEALKEKKLSFNVDDITHIIIKEEAELIDIINNINSRDFLCGQPIDETGKAKLLSKIRCLDRIRQDF